MAEKDKELKAIGEIISLLAPLDEAERRRVLEYVLNRLQMAALSVPVPERASASIPNKPVDRAVTDIRTLTAEKQPRSANEMVALVAYYLSDLAPEGDRSETVNAEAIRRYFKVAGFPLPRALPSVLPNAAAAGYLESVSRGEYRLNPVGYNLVVHGLPRGGGPGPASSSSSRGRRTSVKKKRHAGRRGH